jgi:hypothetical protein
MSLVSLKRTLGAEIMILRSLCSRPARPAASVASVASADFGSVGLVRSARKRAAIVRQLASVVAFCRATFVPVVVHAAVFRVSPRGTVSLSVGVPAPDTRYLAPEGQCASWAIGAILFKLVTGKPLVHAPDLAPEKRIRRIARCVGTPNWRECAALGIREPSLTIVRARARGSTRAERAVLESTLAWVAADRMLVTARGLACLPTIPE